jgi:hypothetical protein
MSNGCPGIGGSLGQCAFCGKPFVREILMGESLPTFAIDQIDGALYAHRSCMDKYESCQTILEWPDESPVKIAILKHNVEVEATAKEEGKQ